MAPTARAARVSDAEVEAVVWAMVRSADLQTLTPKLIRAHVRTVFSGDALGRDESELKVFVKDLIPTLLAKRAEEVAGGERSEGGESDQGDGEGGGEGEGVGGGVGGAGGEGQTKASKKKRKIADSEDDESDIGQGVTPDVVEATVRASPMKKARAENPATSDADDADGGVDSDAGGNGPKKAVVKRKAKAKAKAKLKPVAKASNDEDAPEADASASDFGASDSGSESSSAPRRRGKKTSAGGAKAKGKAKARATTNGPQVVKIMRVARELGCRIPPTVLRGTSGDSEKLRACRRYLEGKGVEGDVLKMRSGAVAELREKLDREKEVRELDVGNIIEEGGRGRARRGRGKVVEKNVMSESEDEEGESEGGDSSESEFEMTQ